MNRLHSVCSDGNLEELKAIVTEGRCASCLCASDFNLEVYNICGMNPLHSASYFGRLEIVEYLVENRLVDVNSLSRSPHNTQASALHYAIVGNHRETIRYLLEQGADPFIRDYRGHTALSLARLHQHKKIIHHLQEFIKERNRKYLESNRVSPISSFEFSPRVVSQHTFTVRSWDEFKQEPYHELASSMIKKSLSLDGSE